MSSPGVRSYRPQDGRLETPQPQALRSQPRGGIVLRGPWGPRSRVWIDGRAWRGAADAITLPGTPARVRVEVVD